MNDDLIAIVLFSLASNLDNLGFGIAYGLRGVKVPWLSNAVVAGVSGFATWLTMVAGGALATLLPGSIAHWLGAALMGAIGLWICLRAMLQPAHAGAPSPHREISQVLRVHIRSLGLIIQILREPGQADLNRSGSLDWKEAILLGLALALNVLAGGLGIGMVGFPPVATALAVTGGSFLSLLGGWHLGRRAAGGGTLGQRAELLAGLLLIALAIYGAN